MLRTLGLALFLAWIPSVTAQSTPYAPTPLPQQPGPPQQQQQTNDPNAVPGAPPGFAPGVGAANDAAPSARHRSVRISGGVMAGNLLTRVDPIYPDEARSAHLSGTVVMSAHIGSSGHVESLSVLSGPAPLQQAAVTAVKQWTYKPYFLNGEPVAVDTTITVNFNLQPSP